MNRLLILIPLLLLLSACAISHAQDSTSPAVPPTMTPEEEKVFMGCIGFYFLISDLDEELAGGQSSRREHPVDHLARLRDVNFAKEPRMKAAADALHDYLWRKMTLLPNSFQARLDPWKAVTAARQIDRLCHAKDYGLSGPSPDVIVEYACAGIGQRFRGNCRPPSVYTHDHGYIPWDHEHD